MSRLRVRGLVIVAAVALTIGALGASTMAGDGRPRELGDVDWLRDHDAAQSAARASGKPISISFDEVPGCATCVSYGETVLRHDEAGESGGLPRGHAWAGSSVYDNPELCGAATTDAMSTTEAQWRFFPAHPMP